MPNSKRIFKILSTLLAVNILAFTLTGSNFFLNYQQNAFLKSFESKNALVLPNFINNDYSDRWGLDKSGILNIQKELFSKFPSVSIRTRDASWFVNEKEAICRTKLDFNASGNALALFVSQHINKLPSPFLFYWHKDSWLPWDWKLTKTEQNELEIPDMSDLPTF